MKRQLSSLALIIFLLPIQVLAANLQQKNADFQKKDQAELMAKVAGGYGAIGETRQALQILDNALKLAKPLPKDSYKDLALREICQQYVAIAHLDKAIEAANAMPQDTLKVYCLTTIAATYRTQGNKTLAGKVIDQALQTANAISVEKSDHEESRYAEEPKSLALVNVIEELIASEQLEQALRLAKTIPLASYRRQADRKILEAKTEQSLKPDQEKAKPIAIIPTKVCTGVPVNKLLRCAFQKALSQEQSLEKHIFGRNFAFSGIPEVDKKAFDENQFFQKCKVKPFDQPDCIAKGVDRTARMGVFKLFLEQLTKDEKPAETQEILAQVLPIIQSSESEFVQPEAMAQIATRYAEVGQKPKAMEILATALSIAENYGRSKFLSWF